MKVRKEGYFACLPVHRCWHSGVCSQKGAVLLDNMPVMYKSSRAGWDVPCCCAGLSGGKRWTTLAVSPAQKVTSMHSFIFLEAFSCLYIF